MNNCHFLTLVARTSRGSWGEKGDADNPVRADGHGHSAVANRIVRVTFIDSAPFSGTIYAP